MSGPSPRCEGLGIRTRDHDGLGHDGVRALADAAGDSPSGLGLAALVATLYHASPRLGVALRMDVRDAELTAARIHLRGRRDWQVPVDDATLGRLARWIACRAALGLGDGLMFCTSDGGPLDDSCVRSELGRPRAARRRRHAIGAEVLRRCGVAPLVAAGVGDAHLQERRRPAAVHAVR